VTEGAPPPRLDPGRLERAFDLVARQVNEGRAGFAALAVGRGDGLVRSSAFVPGRMLDSPRRSSIASITKPVTATAILQLVESGRLVLGEPLSTYLPGFRPPPAPDGKRAVEPMTTWHVLTHTAGLSDPPDHFYESGAVTRERILERLGATPLRFAPGTAYAYASDSYYLLAELIERLSGAPYPTVLRDRILAPLGMAATTFDPAEAGPEAVPIEGQIGPADRPRDEVIASFIALAMPGGGLWSTADDIVRFGRSMLLGGTLDGTRVLGRPFVELMTRLHTDGISEIGTGRAPGYGLGWGRTGLGRGSPASPSAFGHNGASGSTLIVDPAYDLVVVYLRNDWGATMTATDEAVQAVYAALD
jgi:CubicO group peptidase (beta-lactamase class C family)